MRNIPKRLQCSAWYRLGFITGYQINGFKEFLYKDRHGNLLVGIPGGHDAVYVNTIHPLSFNLG